MAKTSTFEELQSKLVGRIASIGQDKRCEVCVLFKILEVEIENKSRLTLVTIFIAEIDKQVSALKPDEVTASGEPTLQKAVRTEAEEDRIKDLEADIAALKTQQEKELQAARDKLREAKNEMGVRTGGCSSGRLSMANLKLIYSVISGSSGC